MHFLMTDHHMYPPEKFKYLKQYLSTCTTTCSCGVSKQWRWESYSLNLYIEMLTPWKRLWPPKSWPSTHKKLKNTAVMRRKKNDHQYSMILDILKYNIVKKKPARTITLILKILFYLLSKCYIVIIVYMYITLSEITKKYLSKLLNVIKINFFLQIFLTYLKLMWLTQNFSISF